MKFFLGLHKKVISFMLKYFLNLSYNRVKSYFFLYVKKCVGFCHKIALTAIFYMLKYFFKSLISNNFMQTKNYFYVLNNNFSYTQRFFFSSERFDRDDNGAFFLFPPQKDFYICPRPFFNFVLFLLQKDFSTFHVFLFKHFLCF